MRISHILILQQHGDMAPLNGQSFCRFVYVATTKAKTLLVYARKSDNSLDLKQVITCK